MHTFKHLNDNESLKRFRN